MYWEWRFSYPVTIKVTFDFTRMVASLHSDGLFVGIIRSLYGFKIDLLSSIFLNRCLTGFAFLESLSCLLLLLLYDYKNPPFWFLSLVVCLYPLPNFFLTIVFYVFV